MPKDPRPGRLRCERLEDREVPAAAVLAAGTLTVTGTDAVDRIRVVRDGDALLVLDGSLQIGAFSNAAVTAIAVDVLGGNDSVVIGNTVTQPAAVEGGAGNDVLSAGGGFAALSGGPGDDTLIGGRGGASFAGGPGADRFLRVRPGETVLSDAADRSLVETPPAVTPPQTITAAEVDTLLRRAAAASRSSDAIIAITDRNGRILGVRVESGVAPDITQNPANLVFAIDGAVAKARTGAFFANNQAPLTSRTVQSLSQSPFTERQINSNPSVTDPNSPLRGPGFVADVGVNGKSHFPPGVPMTPQVDLLFIEHTNRDSTFHPGNDRIKGTADDVELAERFNIDPAFVPAGQSLFPPDSYGFESGVLPGAQNRGIATSPGGVPIFKNGQLVGGIGVFFPGRSGFATEENSRTSSTFNPALPDRTAEAEFIAFAAVGGFTSALPGFPTIPIGTLGGVAPLAGFGLPNGRVDLVGITLDIIGPGGNEGPKAILEVGQRVGSGQGNPDDGTNQVIDVDANDDGTAGDAVTLRDGLLAPEGWLVMPHDGDGLTAADVTRIITQGIAQSVRTRAAIRLPLSVPTKMVFAVADRQGEILGLFREPDATIFSIDVAVAKARNANYYADPSKLQVIDRVEGTPPGTAFTARTFRFLAQPRFPQGLDGEIPGPFSQLLDGGSNRFTGRTVGAPKPASTFVTVVGNDAFNPQTNFRDPTNILNQNGIVFFPGSAPLYKPATPGAPATLVGGFGVSGDGVDQDDVVTSTGQEGFLVPEEAIRADEVLVRGVRLPYQKYNRNPTGGIPPRG
ncbi:MAG: hypothetical protein C0501_22665 [Isosphaera sp.]|nr:hypothetical protein [Isosphaera sp.]